MTQNNLGDAPSDLGLMRGSEALIEEGIKHIEAALAQFQQLGVTAYIEWAEQSLAQARERLMQVKDGRTGAQESSLKAHAMPVKRPLEIAFPARLQPNGDWPAHAHHAPAIVRPFFPIRTNYHAKSVWPEKHRRHLNKEYGLDL